MKKIIFAAAISTAFLFAPRNTSAQEISFGMFYSSLAPYGQWVSAGSLGMCWRPSGMRGDWAPYTSGHWVWSDYGWTWVSNYPWGWAPFHYGRWVIDSNFGWIWVPGYVWGPAWVQWRWGGGYCGWAPLPPGFHFRVDVNIGPNDRDFGVGPRGWNFVRANEMGLHRYRFINRDATGRVIARTRNVTRFRFTSRGVYNIGLPREEVERVTHRRISTVNIYRTNEIGKQRIIGHNIHIFSPAPFEPRIRNEENVIRRERVYRTPQRVPLEQRDRARPRREMQKPNYQQGRQAPRVKQHKQDTVRPHHVPFRRLREIPRQQKNRNNNQEEPRHRH